MAWENSHGIQTTCSQLRTCHQKVFQLRLPHNVRYNTLKTVEKRQILARVLRLLQKMVQHAPRCDAVPFFAPRRRQCRRVQHAPRCGKTAILADSRFFEISFFDSFQFYQSQRYNTQHAGTVCVEIYRPRRCRTRYNTLRAAVKATFFNLETSFPMELRLSHGEWTTCNQLRICH